MEKKITEEQLTKIQEQQTKLNELINQVGYIEMQKHGLMHEFGGVNQEVEDYKKELESQYGAININVENGTYVNIEKETKEETPENV